MKDGYLIWLREYDGDSYFGLVEKEVFEWITSPSDEPEGADGIWVSTNAPKRLAEAIAKEESDIQLTCGSYENDRAIYCTGARSLIEFDFDINTKKGAIEFAEKNGYKVKGTYKGYMY